jgi:hypothetical protein
VLSSAEKENGTPTYVPRPRRQGRQGTVSDRSVVGISNAAMPDIRTAAGSPLPEGWVSLPASDWLARDRLGLRF